MRQTRTRRVPRALLIAILAFLFSPAASAVDVHYAGAIGDPYGYDPPPAEREQSPQRSRQPSGASGSALPGLGTETRTPAAAKERSTWMRVVLGIVAVGAMAAIANRSGGSTDAQVGVDLGGGGVAGGGSSTGPSGSPPPSSDGGSSGGSAPDTAPPPASPPSGGGDDNDRGKGRGDKGKGKGKDKD